MLHKQSSHMRNDVRAHYIPEREGAWPCMTAIEADLNRGVSDTSVADDVMQYVQIRSLCSREEACRVWNITSQWKVCLKLTYQQYLLCE